MISTLALAGVIVIVAYLIISWSLVRNSAYPRLKSVAMDTTVPHYPRFRWPKAVPPLDAEQRRISDDFMRHWHEICQISTGL